MKHWMKKIFVFTLLLGIVFSVGSVVLAQASGTTGDNPPDPSGNNGGVITLENPLGVDDPRDIIGNVIRAILGIVGSLALLIFIYGGFSWITAAGSDEKIKKGKDMIFWATFGLGVIFLSYMLVTFIIGGLTEVAPSSNDGPDRNSISTPDK